MELNLKKPLLFFDLETTGVNFQTDRIVEISYIKLYPNGTEEAKTMRFNPGCPIPAEATAVHHITDSDVADKPPFKSMARSLADTFTGCDIAGYNHVKFDLPLLMEEFLRAGVDDFDPMRGRLIDVQTIYHKLEQRTLSAAYRFYCGGDLDNAHSADADTRATMEVLKAQLDHYPDVLKNDMDFLASFSSHNNNVDMSGRIIYNDKGIEVFNFGKHKGRPVQEVFDKEPSYYDWMMKGEFPSHTKQVITRIKLRAR